MLLASTYGGVFKTTNGAKSWQPYGRGLPAGGVAAFTFDPNGSTVYAATNGDGVDTLQHRRLTSEQIVVPGRSCLHRD